MELKENELNYIEAKLFYLNKYEQKDITMNKLFVGLTLIQIFNLLIALLDFISSIKKLYKGDVKWWQVWKLKQLKIIIVVFVKQINKIIT